MFKQTKSAKSNKMFKLASPMLTDINKDVFISHIFPSLSCTDCLELIQTCKTFSPLKSVVSKKFLERVSKVFIRKQNSLVNYLQDTRFDDDLLGFTDPLSTLTLSSPLISTHPSQEEDLFHLILPVLTKLTELGVLSGGSVVYGLNDFVESSSIGDYDIYFPTPETFMQAHNLLLSTGCVKNLSTLASVFYGGVSCPYDDDSKLSILNFDLDFTEKLDQTSHTDTTYKKYYRLGVIIQLIYHPFSDPSDIVTHFDLDYVQCAFYQGQIFRTKDCRQSHLKQEIITGYMNPKIQRMQKALRKGFRTPLVGAEISTVSSDKAYVKLDLACKIELAPFNPRSTKRFSFDSLRIKKLMIKTVEPKDDKWYDVHLHTNMGSDEDDHITSSTYLEINVLSYDKKKKWYEIQPFQINDDFTISKFRSSGVLGTQYLGRQTVEVKFVYRHKFKNYKSRIYMNIVRRLNSFPKLIPSQFSDSVSVETLKEEVPEPPNRKTSGRCG